MIDRITLADTKRAGYCVKGVRKFVEAAGMDFRDFARNGMPIEKARAMDGWQAFVSQIERLKARHDG